MVKDATLLFIALFVSLGTGLGPCVHHVESLQYPQLARNASIQGVAVVRARIGTSGNVVEVDAVSGHPLLKRAAVANAKTWKFDAGPATTVEIRYEFKLVKPAVDYVPPTKVTFDLPTAVFVTSSFAKPNT